MTQGYDFLKHPVEFVRARQQQSIETDASGTSNSFYCGLTGNEARDFYESLLSDHKSEVFFNDSKKGFQKAQKRKKDIKPSKVLLKRIKSNNVTINRSKYQPTATDYFKAAEEGNLVAVKRILETRIIDINATDQFSWTAIMMAANKGHEEIVKLLLFQGAEWEDKIDGSGYDAYDLACLSGHNRIAHMLQHRKSIIKAEALQSAIAKARKLVKREKVWCEVCEVHYTISSDESRCNEHVRSVSHQFSSMRKEGTVPQSSFYISPSNKGYRLLQNQGWDGSSGLGPTSSGRKYPVKTILKRDRSGIGCFSTAPRVTHFQSKDITAVSKPKREKLKIKLKNNEEKTKDLEIEFRRSFY